MFPLLQKKYKSTLKSTLKQVVFFYEQAMQMLKSWQFQFFQRLCHGGKGQIWGEFQAKRGEVNSRTEL